MSQIVQRLDHHQHQERATGITREERDHVVPALALRSYHLPGNSWCDDWLQYHANNHPVCGICCHDRRHPLNIKMRLWHLLGSIAFGLCVTNFLWLWFFYHQEDDGEPAVIIDLRGFGVQAKDNSTSMTDGNEAFPDYNTSEIEITKSVLLLWTLGSALHALFDNTVWYLSVCVCCLPGRPLHRFNKFKCCGTNCVIFTVVLFTALATLAVVVRASIEEAESEQDNILERNSTLNASDVTEDDDIDLLSIHDASAYEFLISYCIELLTAWLVYYPVVGTILFSG
jgi:hypothetical protein